MSASNTGRNVVHFTGTPNQDKHAANKYYVDYKSFSIGDLKQSTRTADHYGWLICNGQAISRTEYSELFAIIATSFGVGDGSTTFNVPDARGRVIGTIGTGTGLTARTLGQSTGAETHTLTVSEIPSHSHSITDPGHSHTYINQIGDQNTDNAFATEMAADQHDYDQTTGTSTTGITINSTGGGGAHNNMQPTLFAANVFIYAKTVLAQ